MSGRKYFLDSEIEYLQKNYKTMSVKQIAEALDRPYSSVFARCAKLKKRDLTSRSKRRSKRAELKEDELNKRFKNPLLRVAVNRTALPDDWTPINRLDELWKYEGRCKRISALEEVCEK